MVPDKLYFLQENIRPLAFDSSIFMSLTSWLKAWIRALVHWTLTIPLFTQGDELEFRVVRLTCKFLLITDVTIRGHLIQPVIFRDLIRSNWSDFWQLNWISSKTASGHCNRGPLLWMLWPFTTAVWYVFEFWRLFSGLHYNRQCPSIRVTRPCRRRDSPLKAQELRDLSCFVLLLLLWSLPLAACCVGGYHRIAQFLAPGASKICWRS